MRGLKAGKNGTLKVPLKYGMADLPVTSAHRDIGWEAGRRGSPDQGILKSHAMSHWIGPSKQRMFATTACETLRPGKAQEEWEIHVTKVPNKVV